MAFLSDLALTVLALQLADRLRVVLPVGEPFTTQIAPNFAFPFWLYVLVPAIWALVFTSLSVYDARRASASAAGARAVLKAVSFGTLILAGIIYFSVRELSRLLFLYFYLVDLLLLVGWRLVAVLFKRIKHARGTAGTRRVLIVGSGAAGQRVREMILERNWLDVKLLGFVDDPSPLPDSSGGAAAVLGRLDEAPRVVAETQADEVIIALPREEQDRLVRLVADLQPLPVLVYVVPDLFDLAFFQTTVESYDGVPLVGLRDPVIDGLPRYAKRAFDLILVLASLPFALPLMAAIAVAIRLDSPGPVLYRQQRVGENGKLFTMLKFRSMCEGAEKRLDEVLVRCEGGQILFKSEGDPRVTRVGRFLRSWSLDELPQLFNVLRGDMSLVGPRPEQPWLVECYEPWQRKRFAVPPGMTGWWQVNGRADKPMHLNTDVDLYYIQNYSLLLDLRILWRTIGAVIKRKGAR